MRDYNKEAEAVCKLLGGYKWDIEVRLSNPLQYLVRIHFKFCSPNDYDMQSGMWRALVEDTENRVKGTKMTDEELDKMLEDLFENEEYLSRLADQLADLEDSKIHILTKIDHVTGLIRQTRDRLRSA